MVGGLPSNLQILETITTVGVAFRRAGKRGGDSREGEMKSVTEIEKSLARIMVDGAMQNAVGRIT